ncbi:MAG: serine/threonine-protein kinase [Microcoleaceae cyanobacterium MO_207.B10]|nr:serine/threonine-protein kinase [Microcoleaceae cyanobacterium MO_207.B10]
MNNFPNFSENGYQIIDELGYNNVGGRVTYLGKKNNSQTQVVIKQFQFAKMGATWAEYDAYEQEIAMLQHLQHPGIPRYLDSFQTSDGFCMVQEYIDAPSLAIPRSWTPQQLKQIAIATLNILVYLQSLNPPIIHRDIKPENILADEELNVYLVDFGFARRGGGKIAASSVVKGTMGFMPPEQLFNRQLTFASDLYGLGATLICLLTGTTSGNIGNLIDADYQIQFRHLLPPLKRGWINWLEKMTAPNLRDRYHSAAEALATLKPIDVERLPKVRLSSDRLEFTATEFAQQITEIIRITNPIPDTILSGRWEVAPHISDPPHTPYDHSWISFSPQKFEGNQIECKITVDTSNLLAKKTYQRELYLRVNSDPYLQIIPVEIHTATLPNVDNNILNFLGLGMSGIFFGICLSGLVLFPGFIFIGTMNLFVAPSAKHSLFSLQTVFILFVANFFAREASKIKPEMKPIFLISELVMTLLVSGLLMLKYFIFYLNADFTVLLNWKFIVVAIVTICPIVIICYLLTKEMLSYRQKVKLVANYRQRKNSLIKS